MHSRNSGRNTDSWLLENDLTSEEIYSSDFLKGFTGREPFEILPLQLWRSSRKLAHEVLFFKKKKLPLHQQYGALNQQSLETREGQRSFWTLKKGHCSGENVKWFFFLGDFRNDRARTNSGQDRTYSPKSCLFNNKDSHRLSETLQPSAIKREIRASRYFNHVCTWALDSSVYRC